jgi:aminoglycoside phosphotransferase (APT) family kinase protein
MTTVPADQHRDPAILSRLNAAAAAIFASHGVDFATARRCGGWTNATWLAGGLALRLAVHEGRDNIRWEARLAALFPPEVGYPPIVACGVTDGFEWSLALELPGRNLGEVWSELDWDGRIAALRQLWARTRAVHTVPVDAAAPLARQQPWFNVSNAGEAEAGLDRLVKGGVLHPDQAEVLAAILGRFWNARPKAPLVLNHGDLTIENALWHEGRVTALLDFEFAVMAPVELDLNELVKMAFAPGERDETFSDPDGAGRQRLRAAVAEMARPLLDHPGGMDLLTGYASLLELWLLEDWLAHPEGEGPLEGWQPYLMLVSLAGGQGGYLAPLW